MSSKSDRFAQYKAERDAAHKAATVNNRRIIESLPDNVRVTDHLPDTAESKESAILIAGMTDTVLNMLPPWPRFMVPPADMVKRARGEDGEYRRDGTGAIILIPDVKLWNRHCNAALRAVRDGSASIVNGKYDLPFPIYPNRMLRLIADGNMSAVLDSAPELLRAITNRGKSVSTDESAIRALDDGFLDGAASNLVDPCYAPIVLAAARLTTARRKLDKQKADCDLYFGTAKYTEAIVARDKTAESIPALESAFRAVWTRRHTIKTVSAPIVTALAPVKAVKGSKQASKVRAPRKTRAGKGAPVSIDPVVVVIQPNEESPANPAVDAALILDVTS